MDISIIIPLYNEQDSIKELNQRLLKVISQNSWQHELLYIDDGSTDNSWEVIKELHQTYPESIKAIRFKTNKGKTKALSVGFKRVTGKVVITIDADLQDRPEEIPNLYAKLRLEGHDIVSGWKQNRKDPALSKNLPSKVFNFFARTTSGLELHDFNCGLKAYKLEVVRSFELYGDMHRYLPVLASNNGYKNIAEIKIVHEARKYGESKFGNERFIRGFLDLLTLWFINKFIHRPMHFFGAIGSFIFILGFFLAAIIGIDKLNMLYREIPAILVTNNPFFYISLTCMLLGSQMFLAGFLAEILLRSSRERSSNDFDEIIE